MTGSHHYVCRYCRQPSDPHAVSCPRCGAPVDVRSAVTRSGWQQQPAIPDMARIQFGQSRVQIEGTMVPVADFALAAGEWIYFSHHALLWTDPSAQLTTMGLSGGWNRMMAGLPLLMVEGRGPGHIALADNHAGEVIALPLGPGQRIWVREHRFLAANGAVGYSWLPTDVWYVTGSGDDREWNYPLGRYGDVFVAGDVPGLMLVHAPGNTFVRDLAPGETLLIQPSALLYRDESVRAHLHLEYPRSQRSFFFSSYSYRTVWLRLIGPGRVAVTSVYARPESSKAIVRHSYATQTQW